MRRSLASLVAIALLAGCGPSSVPEKPKEPAAKPAASKDVLQDLPKSGGSKIQSLDELDSSAPKPSKIDAGAEPSIKLGRPASESSSKEGASSEPSKGNK